MEPREFVDRSPGPEATYLIQQAILLVRQEVRSWAEPTLHCQPLLRIRMSVARGGEGARDHFARRKVSSSARASQAAFFACGIWNLHLPRSSSTVGRTHHLDRLSVRLRTSPGSSRTAIMFSGLLHIYVIAGWRGERILDWVSRYNANVKGLRKACPDRTVITGPRIVSCLVRRGILHGTGA